MATTVKAEVISSVNVTHKKPVDLGVYSGNPGINFAMNFSTTDVTKVFTDSRTFTTSEVLDLTALTDTGYLASISFTHLKHLTIHNTHASVALVVGLGTLAAMGTDQRTVPAGGCEQLTGSFAISGTAKNLQFAASAGAYDIVMLGD